MDKKKLHYQRISGSFVFKDEKGNKKTIKTGQKFEAYPSQLSSAQMSRTRCLSEGGEQPSLHKIHKRLRVGKTSKHDEPGGLKVPPATHTYKLQPKGVGWFDIVDENGKLITSKSLRKKEADEMIKALQEV
jgi:hypothetical protein